LNALIAVAVDLYLTRPSPPALTGGEETQKDVIKGQIGADLDVQLSPPGPNASKKERQDWTAFQRAQRKLPI
jgi:hypothetical protein